MKTFFLFQADVLRKNLDELEYVISEINAEQKYLLLRLRRVMEEYFKLLKKIGIPINYQIASEHISNQIKSGFSTSIKGLPCSVKRRPSYEELLRRFDIFEEQKHHHSVLATTKPEPKQSISLLKPKDERLQNVPVLNMQNVKSIDDSSSSQVNRSRFNLRQALSKVVIQSSNSENTSPESSASVVKQNSSGDIMETSNKKKLNSDSNSSSEESYEGSTREQTPDNIDIVADTQETFLRLLQLCTKDQASTMSQRRSKRKRRCVQNNDKPDFLYGHIDFDVIFYY